MPKRNTHQTAAQLKFKAVNGWGGKRRGAGRKNQSGKVSHSKREKVDFKRPLHLTLKVRDPKWSLRCGEIAAAFKNSAKGAQKFGLRILHYSLLKDHIHILVEARNNEDLARGMRSFGARMGKAIRKIVGGRGAIFKGRFHLRVVTNPTQMRNTLAYVLQNFSKHTRLLKHVDAYSSAPYFGQWRKLFGRGAGPILDGLSRPPPLPDFLCAPVSWLAREGWRRARGPALSAGVGRSLRHTPVAIL